MEIRSTASAAAVAPSYDKAAPAAALASTPAAPRQAESAISAEAVKPAQPAPKAEDVDKAVKTLNEAIQARNPQIEFTLDKDSSRTIVTVVDSSTKEVIRQMPSKEALELAKAIDKIQSLLAKQTA